MHQNHRMRFHEVAATRSWNTNYSREKWPFWTGNTWCTNYITDCDIRHCAAQQSGHPHMTGPTSSTSSTSSCLQYFLMRFQEICFTLLNRRLLDSLYATEQYDLSNGPLRIAIQCYIKTDTKLSLPNAKNRLTHIFSLCLAHLRLAQKWSTESSSDRCHVIEEWLSVCAGFTYMAPYLYTMLFNMLLITCVKHCPNSLTSGWSPMSGKGNFPLLYRWSWVTIFSMKLYSMSPMHRKPSRNIPRSGYRGRLMRDDWWGMTGDGWLMLNDWWWMTDYVWFLCMTGDVWLKIEDWFMTYYKINYSWLILGKNLNERITA